MAHSENEQATNGKIQTQQKYDNIEEQIKNGWRDDYHASINPNYLTAYDDDKNQFEDRATEEQRSKLANSF